MICCWRRCEYPWIGIACSAKTYSKEPLSTMKEELKHLLNKFPSQVLLATEQPATLTPKATSLPPPLLICLFEWTQKCFFKWSSICNHSSALLVPAPGAGLNNAMSSPRPQNQPLISVAVSTRQPLLQQPLHQLFTSHPDAPCAETCNIDLVFPEDLHHHTLWMVL